MVDEAVFSLSTALPLLIFFAFARYKYCTNAWCTGFVFSLARSIEAAEEARFLKKNQNAPRPSEHPPVMGLFTYAQCVCYHPIYSGRQTCGRTSRGHTGFLHLPSAVLASIFSARRIQPSLSLVDRKVEFCVPTN